MTTKEKIDKALGISCGKSMDQMLDELNLDSDKIENTLNGFDETIKTEIENIDRKAVELQQGVGNGILAISDMTTSLKEIENLICEAKQIFLHIKENIISTDLIDSELIQGAAKFLEAMHVNIAEFISIYKQKSKFIEKVKLMIFQQQQRIELANLRHKQNLELIEAKKSEPETIDAKESGNIEFDTDTIIRKMSETGSFNFNVQDTQFLENDTDDDDDVDDEEPSKKKRKSK